ncbi:MAG: hypothetical protein AAGA85_01805 [Bacteroidota bacterium]
MGADAKQKYLLRSGLLLWALNVVGWSAGLYRHYFDLKTQDVLAMAAWMAVSVVIGIIIRQGQAQLRGKPWLVWVLVVTHFATSSLLDWFVLHTYHGWTLIYGYLTLTGLAIGQFWSYPSRVVMAPVVTLFAWLLPTTAVPGQQLYYDKVVHSLETKKGVVHTAQWKGDVWTHYNKQLSVSTIDAHMFYEPLVHPIMQLAPTPTRVLLIGGDNGAAVTELRKYQQIQLEVLPYDMEFFRFSVGKTNFRVHDAEIFHHLTLTDDIFDVIIVDLPDPRTIATNQYYTLEFYKACHSRLTATGQMVTQSGSPYLQASSFRTILTTLQSAGFATVPFHNQVPSLGQWSWVLAGRGYSQKDLEEQLSAVKPQVPTVWWNQEAMWMMMSFGKTSFFHDRKVAVNRMDDPMLGGRIAARRK